MAAKIPRDVLVLSILAVSCTLSFAFGYLAAQEAGRQGSRTAEASPAELPDSPGQVVASRNGTKFYPPDCPAAARLSKATKVWFPSPAAAIAAGYSAASNCAGF